MEYKVIFFNKKVEKDTLNFPKGILANFLHIVEMIKEFGSDLGLPYTSKVEKEIFEIRSKGSEGIGRSLFCTKKGKKVIILHSFIKKTKKIPKKELEIARKRLKELKKNEYNNF